METLAPRNEAEAADAVTAAIANGTPLEILGTGSKRALGRPVTAALGLSSAAMMGVSLYEPSELVLRAASGTSIRSIVDLLNQRGQELAFEPTDFGPLFGREALAGTIGGIVAINASGPRRIKAGAARDHLLGFRAVSGRGEIFQSGGRVMKNVTGYDLSKLMTGSYGTLAFLTEITLKVLPKAPAEETLIIAGLNDADAVAVLTEAAGLPHDVSGLAHLPVMAAGTLEILSASNALTAFRLEGPESSIAKRKDDLLRHFRKEGWEFDSLEEARSKQFWAAIRDVLPLAALDAYIWRLSTTPTEGPSVISKLLQSEMPLKGWYYDWAGGLIWLAVEPNADAHAGAIRTAVAAFGGHATLIRAPEAIRAKVPVFHPQEPALAALGARVKASFDPERMLNRGRLREDL